MLDTALGNVNLGMALFSCIQRRNRLSHLIIDRGEILMPNPNKQDSREGHFVDIDRMVNEGLGGGNVTIDNGLIEESIGSTLKFPDSVIDKIEGDQGNKKKN